MRVEDHYSDFEIAINPPYKMEIRTDFPVLYESEDCASFFKNLCKLIEDVEEDSPSINIMYSQKDPNTFPDYIDGAKTFVADVKGYVAEFGDEINLRFRDDIFETVSLNRSSRYPLGQILTKRQLYTMPEQEIKPGGIFAGEKFILIDHCVDKGGTLTNMTDFIEHNGGKVLGALVENFVSSFVDDKGYYLPQRDASRKEISRTCSQIKLRDINNVKLSKEFLEAGHNNKRLKQLAATFSLSLKLFKDVERSPERCIVAFEKALNRHGNSLLALTDTQCRAMASRMENTCSNSFYETFKYLQETEPCSISKCPPYSPILKMEC